MDSSVIEKPEEQQQQAQPPQDTVLELGRRTARQSLMRVVHLNTRWRAGLRRFAFVLLCYQLYLAWRVWQRLGFVPPSIELLFGEDASLLMHGLGVTIATLMVIKTEEALAKSKRLRNFIILLTLTECSVWFRHYAPLLDLSKPESVWALPQFPGATLFCIAVELQELYMRSEEGKVLKAYNLLEELARNCSGDVASKKKDEVEKKND